jgi:hypothetical protein
MTYSYEVEVTRIVEVYQSKTMTIKSDTPLEEDKAKELAKETCDDGRDWHEFDAEIVKTTAQLLPTDD